MARDSLPRGCAPITPSLLSWLGNPKAMSENKEAALAAFALRTTSALAWLSPWENTNFGGPERGRLGSRDPAPPATKKGWVAPRVHTRPFDLVHLGNSPYQGKFHLWSPGLWRERRSLCRLVICDFQLARILVLVWPWPFDLSDLVLTAGVKMWSTFSRDPPESPLGKI